MRDQPLPNWVRLTAIAGAGLAILWLESRRPLRPYIEPRLRHTVRNATMAGIGAATIAAVEAPVVERLSARVHRKRQGVLKRLGLPGWLETAAAVVLLDYTLYIWQRAARPALQARHGLSAGGRPGQAMEVARAFAGVWGMRGDGGRGVDRRPRGAGRAGSEFAAVLRWLERQKPGFSNNRRVADQEVRPDLKWVRIGVPGVDRPEQVMLPRLVVMPAEGTVMPPVERVVGHTAERCGAQGAGRGSAGSL